MIRLNNLKSKRDEKIMQLVPEDKAAEETYYKNKSIHITNMMGTIFKNANACGNPLQSMAVRNIRHFENIRRKTLEKVRAENQAKQNAPTASKGNLIISEL